MKATWLVNEGRSRVILFFAGWGIEPGPFRSVGAVESDVLMLYDYRELTLPERLDELLADREDVSLLAWSLGVAVANTLCRELSFRAATAVNGTPFPVDDQCGIPAVLFDGTIAHLPSGGWERFVRRMCGGQQARDLFMSVCTERTVEDRLVELKVLRHLAPAPHSIYQSAVASRGDRIVPHDNQVRAWEQLGVPCVSREGPHWFVRETDTWEALLG